MTQQGSEQGNQRKKRSITVSSDSVLNSPENSFRQAWQEVKMGEVQPVSELWDGIDAE